MKPWPLRLGTAEDASLRNFLSKCPHIFVIRCKELTPESRATQTLTNTINATQTQRSRRPRLRRVAPSDEDSSVTSVTTRQDPEARIGAATQEVPVDDPLKSKLSLSPSPALGRVHEHDKDTSPSNGASQHQLEPDCTTIEEERLEVSARDVDPESRQDGALITDLATPTLANNRDDATETQRPRPPRVLRVAPPAEECSVASVTPPQDTEGGIGAASEEASVENPVKSKKSRSSSPALGRVHEHDQHTSPSSGASQNQLGPDCTATEEEPFKDGARDVKTHAKKLLRIFDTGKDARHFLATLPMMHPTVAALNQELHLKLSDKGRQGLTDNRLTAAEALRLSTPLWRTTAYPLAVLCEAMAVAQGMPAVFYHDTFVALLGSLIHKDVAVSIGGWECRSRFWVAGTADPGGGKSAAVDPLRDLLGEVLGEQPDLAPGSRFARFHFCGPCTHAASAERLRDNNGYPRIHQRRSGPTAVP